jgi:hypothetical protein
MTEGKAAFICSLPVTLGNDKRCLASVAPLDGKAVVRPSTLRCGILVVDWYKWLRYVRRHCLRSVPVD